MENDYASSQRVALLIILWVYSVYCWITGAFVLPTLEIHVMPGTPFTSFYKRSLALTLLDLYHKKTYFALATLGCFSVCVPAFKLACTLFLIISLNSRTISAIYETHKMMIQTLSCVASYQLLDLYVGVLFVVHFNSDSADARFLSGFNWYYTYCMTSMCMSCILDGVFCAASHVEDNAVEDVPLPEDIEEPSPEGHVVEMARSVSRAISDHFTRRATPVQTEEGDESDVKDVFPCEYPLPRSVDVASTWLLSVAFVGLMLSCYWQAVLEVRTMWQGVSVDRSLHPLNVMFDDFMPSQAGIFVAYPLIAMNVVVPVMYIACLLAMSLAYCGCGDAPSTEGSDLPFIRLCGYIAESLRQWATTDVFCFASLVFLFTVQDARTLTMPTEGSMAYYAFLGAGCALFFLRWFAEGREHEVRLLFGVLPPPRFWILVSSWFAVCFYIGGGFGRVSGGTLAGNGAGGVPGSTKHYSFAGLDSVCAHAMPVLSDTLRRALPAAFGDCGDDETHPPKPCSGSKALYETENGDQFVKAIWLGGVNTVKLTQCRLWKDTAVVNNGTVQYHLDVGGRFEKVQLFLHARQCENSLKWLGCTTMNSPDHCCGTNIGFNVSFGLGCREREGFRDVTLEDADIDPLYVATDFMGGALSISALDIAPKVEGLIKHTLAGFLKSAHLTWAGESMQIPQLINRLIAYNSPGSEDRC